MARYYPSVGRRPYGTSSTRRCHFRQRRCALAIQNSQESLRTLSQRYGINPKTVSTWRKRTSVFDLPTGPFDNELGNPQVLYEQVSSVLGLRGIADFLMDRTGVPYRLSDSEIAQLRDDSLCFQRNQDLPPSRRCMVPLIPADTPVRIVRGVFEGCTGHYFKAMGHGYATICIQLFGQETAVDISDTDFMVDTQTVEEWAA